MDTMNYCNYLYLALKIPIYLYSGNELLVSFPPNQRTTLPPASYLDALMQNKRSFGYCITGFYSYYGCISPSGSNEHIVIGPVSYLPYSADLLHQMHKEFPVSPEETAEFNDFFCQIPLINAEQFFHILDLAHYSLTGKPAGPRGVPTVSPTRLQQTINENYFADSYIFTDSGIQNTSYETERNILPLVEQGDMEGLRSYLAKAISPNLGVMANNNLRQAKNAFIVLLTLVSRAALRGGLSPANAYKLSDTYIQQMERLTDMDAIGQLSYHAMMDFTEKVMTASPLKRTSSDMKPVITYIQNHLNEPLSVESVAAQMGYNRSYLSRRFKQELGFGLSDFIVRCKLETSRYLLAYSNKSLGDISIYLCFSSQSHFQNVFKKQYGMTPLQYRNQALAEQ